MTMTLPTTAVSFRSPRRILFGGGARRQIGEIIRELGTTRPLIVTDEFHARNGVADEIAGLLRASGATVSVWAGTVPDPTMSSVSDAVLAALDHGADSVIGLGGGSSLDTAKAVALLAIRGGEMRAFKAPAVTIGDALPIVAIPTTAGSGSEATQFTVITDDVSAEKMLCVGPVFLPTVAVVDPDLTASMPPRLTADTGIDALTHAVEAYVSRKAGPLSDVFALRAMTLVHDNLLAAYQDGADARARENMMLGSLLAGIAFSNSSVALVHGMSRPLGVRFHVPHGLSNALLFAEVTRFSLAGAPERYADCARALGLPGGDDPAVAGMVLADELARLVRELSVPTLAELGVAPDAWREAIDTMASQALDSGSPANNPIVPTHDDIAALYELVYFGR